MHSALHNVVVLAMFGFLVYLVTLVFDYSDPRVLDYAAVGAYALAGCLFLHALLIIFKHRRIPVWDGLLDFGLGGLVLGCGVTMHWLSVAVMTG